MASAAIPIVFPAVKIGDAFYGDGSVRQTAPLAPAIHLGARRIIGIAMRASKGTGECVPVSRYPVAAEVFGMLFHSVFLDSLDADAERLQRINALLRAVPDHDAVASGMRPVDLLLFRPSRDIGDLAKGCKVTLPKSVQFVVSSMGGERARSSDFLSYLMFQPDYTGILMELGYEDALKKADQIDQFLSK
jgi:NTE family protein